MNLKLDVTKNDNLIWRWGTQQRHFSSWTHHMKIKGMSSCKHVYLAHKNEIHYVEIPCLDKERWGERIGEERGQIYKIML